MASEQLERYDVLLAADGEEALDVHSRTPADAVILDVAMPRMDGLEVCRRMRDAGDDTPVLMLTARDAASSPHCDRLGPRIRTTLRRVRTPGLGAFPACRKDGIVTLDCSRQVFYPRV